MNLNRFNAHKQLAENATEKAIKIVCNNNAIDIDLYNDYDAFLDEYEQDYRDEINAEIAEIEKILIDEEIENEDFKIEFNGTEKENHSDFTIYNKYFYFTATITNGQDFVNINNILDVEEDEYIKFEQLPRKVQKLLEEKAQEILQDEIENGWLA